MLRLPLPGFPDGPRGFALLLLRLSSAIVLAHHAVESWTFNEAWWSTTLSLAALGIILGVFTPSIASTVSALDIVWTAAVRPAEGWSVLLAASILVALVVLGPGAYSLDRWLFGRKRLEIGRSPR